MPESDKHVIFLGAGASYTSGYPIGDALRLRLCSGDIFLAQLEEQLKHAKYADSPRLDLRQSVERTLESFRPTIEMFRQGGFGTVDEFSKLASKSHPPHAQNMKRLTRLAFSLHYPETEFHKSDYYPFLGQLFADDLHSFRNDLTVLSYNYDCYLDLLLWRACERRKTLAFGTVTDELQNIVTSGFFSTSTTAWAQTEGFKYLKLHGSITQPHDRISPYQRMFNSDLGQRMIICRE